MEILNYSKVSYKRVITVHKNKKPNVLKLKYAPTIVANNTENL
jgi:hypothetical protein